jgi:hypothetical protein
MEEPREEYFENQATDVEAESVGEPSPDARPWDPKQIRISTKPFSLRQVVDMITDGDIDLAPDFQRLYVWKPLQRSRLIESILLGIPLPAFYFNQNDSGELQVVDGVQRLTTLYRFARNEETLSDLEYLYHLEGHRFDGLDSLLKRRFQQTQIFVNVIEPQTPDDVKFDVFKRINTGGSPLTPQEIRHCMSRQRSRALLKTLIELPSFHDATAAAFQNERRMTDREVALRFCAFRHLRSFDDYRQFGSLDAFLLDFIRRLDARAEQEFALSDGDIETLTRDFDRAMRTASAVFGNCAFRKYPLWAKRRGPINRALFESWAVALADYQPEQLSPHKEAIVQKTRETMADYQYNAAISQGTGDFSKVKLRFTTARTIIESAIGTAQ